MRKAIGLALFMTIGMFGYAPDDVPLAQGEPADAPALASKAAWTSELDESGSVIFPQCPNCCELDENGRCILCRLVCP
jgi:hypothetical protein